MRQFAQISRSFLAAVGVLALALAYLPGVVCVLNVAPACCTGTMCPMHNASGSHMTCGTDVAHLGAALQTCGCHSAQYTGGSVFNLVTHPLVAGARTINALPTPSQIAFPSIKSEVALPPPRLALG